MGKVKNRRNSSNSSTLSYLVYIAPITVVIILLSFTIIQFLGESLGFSPVIILQSNCLGCTPGETVIVFIIVLSISVFLGLIVSYLLIKIVKRK